MAVMSKASAGPASSVVAVRAAKRRVIEISVSGWSSA
jgi:hypothetical protein